MSNLWDTVQQYLYVYKKSATRLWNQMTPQEYLTIMIVVACVGFYWMGSKKRA